MKLHKKTALCFIAMIFLVAFCGCSEKIELPENARLISSDTEKSIVIPDGEYKPADIYGKIEYTPEMFFGEYSLSGGKEKLEEYTENSDYIDFPSENYEKITAIPYSIAGMPEKTVTNTDENGIEDKTYILSLAFQSDKKTQVIKEASYRIEGKKLICRLAENVIYDDTTGKTSYKFSEEELAYDFEFRGINLILTKDSKSVTLFVNGFSKTPKTISGDVYLSSGEGFFGMERINYFWNDNGKSSFEMYDKEGEKNPFSYAILYDDGRIVFGATSSDGTVKLKNFTYILTVSGGMILSDGTNCHYYTDDPYTAFKKKLLDNLDEEDLEDLVSPEQLAKKRDELVADLIKAFDENGIKVEIDEKTGEISLGAGVLFKGDSATVTPSGKDTLSKVISIYTKVVFSDEYENFLSKIVVEGHAAPVGNTSFESGYPLSKERADNVMKFLVSDETGLSESDTLKLREILEAVGVSSSRPVLDKNGKVDVAASRRVSFRFKINVKSVEK